MKLSNFVAGSGSTAAVSSGFKSSIILLDINPGTRTITLQPGTYRIALVGAGGGADATSALAPGGTTSWAATHSATGGSAGAVGGAGTGGDVNFSGQSTAACTGPQGGGASGTRLGSPPAQPNVTSIAGGGWSGPGSASAAGFGLCDGFGLGLPPGQGMSSGSYTVGSAASAGLFGSGYGSGGLGGTSGTIVSPGMGGGGMFLSTGYPVNNNGGPCGGGAGGNTSIKPGSGGGYSEKVITVTVAAAFSYTVGAPGTTGNAIGGQGTVIVEKL
jgi:hypothetical protein